MNGSVVEGTVGAGCGGAYSPDAWTGAVAEGTAKVYAVGTV